MGNVDTAVKNLIIQLSQYLCLERRFKGFESLDSKKRVGIRYTVEVSARCFGYEKDGSTHHPEWEGQYYKVLHIIVAQPHRVYIARSATHDTHKIKPEEYKNISNHDSEWRSSLDKIYQECMTAYDVAYQNMPENLKPAPIAANIEVSMTPIFNRPFSFVLIERTPLVDQERSNFGYFDAIKSIINLNLDLELNH